MLRVTVELLPFGSESRKRVLGMATIVNDGSGGKAVGNYDVKVFSEGQVKKVGRVEQFARRSKDHWELLRLALNAVSKPKGGL